jgi:hypothetical protein
MRVAVIGGGFFGLFIAQHMAKNGYKVDVYEKEESLMTRASYVNQARIHNGYHYPRSVMTAGRSHQSFSVFCNDFHSCVENRFHKYYAIPKKSNKINSTQFENFCNYIDIECDYAPERVRNMFDSVYVDNVYSVEEFAFNSFKLRDEILKRNKGLNVTINFKTKVNSISYKDSNKILLKTSGMKDPDIEYTHVFNCTYASINEINSNSLIPTIPLTYELTEIAIIKPPEKMRNIGVTVMCGPFFSTMPFPTSELHSLTHVRYTPVREGKNFSSFSEFNNRESLDSIPFSSYQYMISDASRYIPILGESEYKESKWEIKTILPSSENDDSRPILFKSNYSDLDGYHCVMGGKIDNVYDAAEYIDSNILNKSGFK